MARSAPGGLGKTARVQSSGSRGRVPAARSKCGETVQLSTKTLSGAAGSGGDVKFGARLQHTE
jgi:hypothetical protein